MSDFWPGSFALDQRTGDSQDQDGQDQDSQDQDSQDQDSQDQDSLLPLPLQPLLILFFGFNTNPCINRFVLRFVLAY